MRIPTVRLIVVAGAAMLALVGRADAEEPLSRLETVIEKNLSPEKFLSNFSENDVTLLFNFFRAALRGEATQPPAELQQRMEKASRDLAGRMSEAAQVGLDAAEAEVKGLIRGEQDAARSPVNGGFQAY